MPWALVIVRAEWPVCVGLVVTTKLALLLGAATAAAVASNNRKRRRNRSASGSSVQSQISQRNDRDEEAVQ